MSTIRDVHLPFRDALLPASFRGAMFHVDAGAKESGRRIVVHEFPKRELPYSEDMGRRAYQFSVRGYCITYPLNTGIDLYSTDYRRARDQLINELETEGIGVLQLPTLPAFTVVNTGYRWTEEEKAGGYCVFDMTFAEYGLAPSQSGSAGNTQANLMANSQDLQERVLTVMTGLEAQLRKTAGTSTIAPGVPFGGP